MNTLTAMAKQIATEKNKNSIIQSKRKDFHANTSNAVRTGQLLQEAGLITSKDVNQVLSIQKKRNQSLSVSNDANRLFGMILCDLNLVTPVDLYSVLYQNNKIYTMENSLACNDKISKKYIRMLNNEARRGFYSFFDLIIKYKILCISRLQQRIFELYHISYRHVSNFAYAQTDKKELMELLDKNISFQNFTIPMIKKNRSLIVGIVNSRELLFIRDLNLKLPHYRILPVFIPLPHFKSLYGKLYGISINDSFYPEQEKSIPATVRNHAPHSQTFFYEHDKTISSNNAPVNLHYLNVNPSISFKFKTIISNPEKDDLLISNLYSKYEMLRQLNGGKERTERLAYFTSFIQEQFEAIISSCNCNSIEIILTGENGLVNMKARPLYNKDLARTSSLHGLSCSTSQNHVNNKLID